MFTSKISGIKEVLERCKTIVPALSSGKHKGQAGRIGIIGGSLEYTGAPYFAAISALKVGADLVHVFCQQDAGTVIKSYSPELIVHPLLDAENAVNRIEPWLERLHVLVVGPGLGRQTNIVKVVSDIIQIARKMGKPIIIDADGLHLVNLQPNLVKDYNHAILTPNAMEFERLFGSESAMLPLSNKVGRGVTILAKGVTDKIYISDQQNTTELPPGGSNRRCGGQGDLLSGSLATFYHWALEANDPEPAKIAAFAASTLVRQCNFYAFEKFGRSMVAGDMIEEIHRVFLEFFEVTS